MSDLVQTAPVPTLKPAIRSIGLWMAALMSLYIIFMSARALFTPFAFAEYFGVTVPNDPGFLYVYAIRSLFLGVFGLFLLARRHYATLAAYALIASIMAFGDATLVTTYGGPITTIIRHLFTAAFLITTGVLVHRWHTHR